MQYNKIRLPTKISYPLNTLMIPKTFTELIYYKKKEDKIKFEDVEKLASWSKVKRINKFKNPLNLSVNEIRVLAEIYQVTPEFIFNLIMNEYRDKII